MSEWPLKVQNSTLLRTVKKSKFREATRKTHCDLFKKCSYYRATKVHVGNLTRNVTKEHVKEIFSHFGKVRGVQTAHVASCLFKKLMKTSLFIAR